MSSTAVSTRSAAALDNPVDLHGNTTSRILADSDRLEYRGACKGIVAGNSGALIEGDRISQGNTNILNNSTKMYGGRHNHHMTKKNGGDAGASESGGDSQRGHSLTAQQKLMDSNTQQSSVPSFSLGKWTSAAASAAAGQRSGENSAGFPTSSSPTSALPGPQQVMTYRDEYSNMEDALLNEVNLLRSNPKEYAILFEREATIGYPYICSDDLFFDSDEQVNDQVSWWALWFPNANTSFTHGGQMSGGGVPLASPCTSNSRNVRGASSTIQPSTLHHFGSFSGGVTGGGGNTPPVSSHNNSIPNAIGNGMPNISTVENNSLAATPIKPNRRNSKQGRMGKRNSLLGATTGGSSERSSSVAQAGSGSGISRSMSFRTLAKHHGGTSPHSGGERNFSDGEGGRGGVGGGDGSSPRVPPPSSHPVGTIRSNGMQELSLVQMRTFFLRHQRHRTLLEKAVKDCIYHWQAADQALNDMWAVEDSQGFKKGKRSGGAGSLTSGAGGGIGAGGGAGGGTTNTSGSATALAATATTNATGGSGANRKKSFPHSSSSSSDQLLRRRSQRSDQLHQFYLEKLQFLMRHLCASRDTCKRAMTGTNLILDCLSALKEASPVPLLRSSRGLKLAARDTSRHFHQNPAIMQKVFELHECITKSICPSRVYSLQMPPPPLLALPPPSSSSSLAVPAPTSPFGSSSSPAPSVVITTPIKNSSVPPASTTSSSTSTTTTMKGDAGGVGHHLTRVPLPSIGTGVGGHGWFKGTPSNTSSAGFLTTSTIPTYPQQSINNSNHINVSNNSQNASTGGGRSSPLQLIRGTDDSSFLVTHTNANMASTAPSRGTGTHSPRRVPPISFDARSAADAVTYMESYFSSTIPLFYEGFSTVPNVTTGGSGGEGGEIVSGVLGTSGTAWTTRSSSLPSSCALTPRGSGGGGHSVQMGVGRANSGSSGHMNSFMEEMEKLTASIGDGESGEVEDRGVPGGKGAEAFGRQQKGGGGSSSPRAGPWDKGGSGGRGWTPYPSHSTRGGVMEASNSSDFSSSSSSGGRRPSVPPIVSRADSPPASNSLPRLPDRLIRDLTAYTDALAEVTHNRCMDYGFVSGEVRGVQVYGKNTARGLVMKVLLGVMEPVYGFRALHKPTHHTTTTAKNTSNSNPRYRSQGNQRSSKANNVTVAISPSSKKKPRSHKVVNDAPTSLRSLNRAEAGVGVAEREAGDVSTREGTSTSNAMMALDLDDEGKSVGKRDGGEECLRSPLPATAGISSPFLPQYASTSPHRITPVATSSREDSVGPRFKTSVFYRPLALRSSSTTNTGGGGGKNAVRRDEFYTGGGGVGSEGVSPPFLNHPSRSSLPYFFSTSDSFPSDEVVKTTTGLMMDGNFHPSTSEAAEFFYAEEHGVSTSAGKRAALAAQRLGPLLWRDAHLLGCSWQRAVPEKTVPTYEEAVLLSQQENVASSSSAAGMTATMMTSAAGAGGEEYGRMSRTSGTIPRCEEVSSDEEVVVVCTNFIVASGFEELEMVEQYKQLRLDAVRRIVHYHQNNFDNDEMDMKSEDGRRGERGGVWGGTSTFCGRSSDPFPSSAATNAYVSYEDLKEWEVERGQCGSLRDREGGEKSEDNKCNSSINDSNRPLHYYAGGRGNTSFLLAPSAQRGSTNGWMNRVSSVIAPFTSSSVGGAKQMGGAHREGKKPPLLSYPSPFSSFFLSRSPERAGKAVDRPAVVDLHSSLGVSLLYPTKHPIVVHSTERAAWLALRADTERVRIVATLTSAHDPPPTVPILNSSELLVMPSRENPHVVLVLLNVEAAKIKIQQKQNMRLSDTTVPTAHHHYSRDSTGDTDLAADNHSTERVGSSSGSSGVCRLWRKSSSSSSASELDGRVLIHLFECDITATDQEKLAASSRSSEAASSAVAYRSSTSFISTTATPIGASEYSGGGKESPLGGEHVVSSSTCSPSSSSLTHTNRGMSFHSLPSQGSAATSAPFNAVSEGRRELTGFSPIGFVRLTLPMPASGDADESALTPDYYKFSSSPAFDGMTSSPSPVLPAHRSTTASPGKSSPLTTMPDGTSGVTHHPEGGVLCREHRADPLPVSDRAYGPSEREKGNQWRERDILSVKDANSYKGGEKEGAPVSLSLSPLLPAKDFAAGTLQAPPNISVPLNSVGRTSVVNQKSASLLNRETNKTHSVSKAIMNENLYQVNEKESGRCRDSSFLELYDGTADDETRKRNRLIGRGSPLGGRNRNKNSKTTRSDGGRMEKDGTVCPHYALLTTVPLQFWPLLADLHLSPHVTGEKPSFLAQHNVTKHFYPHPPLPSLTSTSPFATSSPPSFMTSALQRASAVVTEEGKSAITHPLLLQQAPSLHGRNPTRVKGYLPLETPAANCCLGSSTANSTSAPAVVSSYPASPFFGKVGEGEPFKALSTPPPLIPSGIGLGLGFSCEEKRGRGVSSGSTFFNEQESSELVRYGSSGWPLCASEFFDRNATLLRPLSGILTNRDEPSRFSIFIPFRDSYLKTQIRAVEQHLESLVLEMENEEEEEEGEECDDDGDDGYEGEGEVEKERDENYDNIISSPHSSDSLSIPKNKVNGISVRPLGVTELSLQKDKNGEVLNSNYSDKKKYISGSQQKRKGKNAKEELQSSGTRQKEEKTTGSKSIPFTAKQKKSDFKSEDGGRADVMKKGNEQHQLREEEKKDEEDESDEYDNEDDDVYSNEVEKKKKGGHREQPSSKKVITTLTKEGTSATKNNKKNAERASKINIEREVNSRIENSNRNKEQNVTSQSKKKNRSRETSSTIKNAGPSSSPETSRKEKNSSLGLEKDKKKSASKGKASPEPASEGSSSKSKKKPAINPPPLLRRNNSLPGKDSSSSSGDENSSNSSGRAEMIGKAADKQANKKVKGSAINSPSKKNASGVLQATKRTGSAYSTGSAFAAGGGGSSSRGGRRRTGLQLTSAEEAALSSLLQLPSSSVLEYDITVRQPLRELRRLVGMLQSEAEACRQQYSEAEAIISPHLADLEAELERKGGKGKESYRLKQQRDNLLAQLDAVAQSLLEIEIVAQEVKEEMTNRARNNVVRQSRYMQLQAELASLKAKASRQFPLSVRLWFCGNRGSPCKVGSEKEEEKEIVLSLSPQLTSPSLLSPTPVMSPLGDYQQIENSPCPTSYNSASSLCNGLYSLVATLTPATNTTITNFTSGDSAGSACTGAITGYFSNSPRSCANLMPSSPRNENNTNDNNKVSSSAALFPTSGEAMTSAISPFMFSPHFPPLKDTHVALLPSTCADGTLYETDVVIPEGFLGSIVLLINEQGTVIWNVVDNH